MNSLEAIKCKDQWFVILKDSKTVNSREEVMDLIKRFDLKVAVGETDKRIFAVKKDVRL